MGAGAVGAPPVVSPEKSIDRPPKGDPPVPFRSVASAAGALTGRLTASPPRSAPSCCLLIDANIPPSPSPGGVSEAAAAGSCVPQLRQDRRAEELQLVCLVYVADAEQDVLGARIADLAEVIDQPLRRLRPAAPVLAHPDAQERRPLDLLVRPPERLAVPAQHRQLVREPFRAAPADVARVAVLGHQAKRLLLAAATDHDRHARAGDGLRRVEQSRRAVVLAVVPALAAQWRLEHAVGDLE